MFGRVVLAMRVLYYQEDDRMAIFEGAGVALVTPFTSTGDVNVDKLEENFLLSSVPPIRNPYRLCVCLLLYLCDAILYNLWK